MKTITMNTLCNKKAYEYGLYMILSNYFDAVYTFDYMKEKRLMDKYKRLSVLEQLKFEEACIAWVEDELMNHVPEEFWENAAEVRFIDHFNVVGKNHTAEERNNGKKGFNMEFITDDYKLVVKWDGEGVEKTLGTSLKSA